MTVAVREIIKKKFKATHKTQCQYDLRKHNIVPNLVYLTKKTTK